MSSKDTPIAVRLPAEPGWCALVIEHDADGNRVKLDDERFKVVAWPVVVWGLVFNCEPNRDLFSLLAGDPNSITRGMRWLLQDILCKATRSFGRGPIARVRQAITTRKPPTVGYGVRRRLTRMRLEKSAARFVVTA